MRRTDPDFRRQLEGYSLATAEIFYRMPDAKSLIQTYVWQDYDLAPEFPNLRKFLDFWTRELDGPIHSVRLAHSRLLRPAELRMVEHEFVLH
ncbi:usg protein [Limibaculum sp. M0105]|uniref:Usg protein n=1 Tax=Thermohalobaculum xanthum TaxID=2753746 RepID=A0A8J7M6D2_9RHOB|nr:usg protein [Thermohalobaculum xanthum]MBK0399083.1 usg protein [Thermohalobaculum xanthum]